VGWMAEIRRAMLRVNPMGLGSISVSNALSSLHLDFVRISTHRQRPLITHHLPFSLTLDERSTFRSVDKARTCFTNRTDQDLPFPLLGPTPACTLRYDYRNPYHPLVFPSLCNHVHFIFGWSPLMVLPNMFRCIVDI
jgi:hypothetical protein